jgi:penicillin amidase
VTGSPNFASTASRGRSLPRRIALYTVALLLLLAVLLFGFWLHLRQRLVASLAPIDGTLHVPGLQAPVTVLRDAHGVPHIEAENLHDLLFAQGWVTASDRLWQMDMARRLPAGEAAAVLGSALVPHDKVERTLGMRDVAARMVRTMPAQQLIQLQAYADGVNAYIQHGQLPAEFSLLLYKPQPWRPVDSMLVALSMAEMLDERWQAKLERAEVTAQMVTHGYGALVGDLYPTGSWRDHPPIPDQLPITTPQAIPEIPLDPSQISRETPLQAPAALLALSAIGEGGPCAGCRPGSNEWAVSGTHTASGLPLLSNDMHLEHSIPDLWYEADLHAGSFHAAGVTVPGLPFVAAGHNDSIAWGFTAMGGDTQDLYLETLNAKDQYRVLLPDGSALWKPISHERETIEVRGGANIHIDVERTDHGPILTPILPHEHRTIALHWTLYDPQVKGLPLYALDSATDWNSFRAALAHWWAPTLNVAYADTQGHIGYQAVGDIPVRVGGLQGTPIEQRVVAPPAPQEQPEAAPVDAADHAHDHDRHRRQEPAALPPPTEPAIHLPPPPPPQTAPEILGEWTGSIPFKAMPSIEDPESGIVATANARITPNGYPYPITLEWADPYRNERIWHWLSGKNKLTQADMLTLQTDVFSQSDQEIAQRLAYAIDHATDPTKRARAAANILRSWNGVLAIDSPGAAIISLFEQEFWPAVLTPKIGKAWQLYDWNEAAFAREQLITDQPAAWLPKPYKDWNNFLTSLVEEAVHKGPKDLSSWHYGSFHTIAIQHPLWKLVPSIPSEVGPLPQSGDHTTVKQVSGNLGPSQRFTADLSHLDNSTENIVVGESGDPRSPYFRDQWPFWYDGRTFPLPFTDAAVEAAAHHTLRLVP